jgi:hypothetical protein
VQALEEILEKAMTATKATSEEMDVDLLTKNIHPKDAFHDL